MLRSDLANMVVEKEVEKAAGKVVEKEAEKAVEKEVKVASMADGKAAAGDPLREHLGAAPFAR